MKNNASTDNQHYYRIAILPSDERYSAISRCMGEGEEGRVRTIKFLYEVQSQGFTWAVTRGSGKAARVVEFRVCIAVGNIESKSEELTFMSRDMAGWRTVGKARIKG